MIASVPGAVSLERRAGGKRLARSNGRGLVAASAIPAIASESHIHIYSANIGVLRNCWYFTVLHCGSF